MSIASLVTMEKGYICGDHEMERIGIKRSHFYCSRKLHFWIGIYEESAESNHAHPFTAFQDTPRILST
jgi:hypothetical protein